MVRTRYQLGLALLVLLLLIAAQSALAAKFYVYQLPDGSRTISDRPILKSTHSLVTSRRQVEGTGQIAAKRYQEKPKSLDKYEDLIAETAERHSVEVALVKAVVHTESYFNPNATSRVGASGLMQLMPKTANKYGVQDIYDPNANLEAGIKHLRYLLKKFPDNIKYVLAAYNAGEKAVNDYNGIPPYTETREYIIKVLHYRDYYRRTY